MRKPTPSSGFACPKTPPSGAVDIATLAEMAWDRGDYDAAANLVDKLEREYRLEGTATLRAVQGTDSGIVVPKGLRYRCADRHDPQCRGLRFRHQSRDRQNDDRLSDLP